MPNGDTGTPGPEGGKVGTEGHKSPGQCGFSKDGLSTRNLPAIRFPVCRKWKLKRRYSKEAKAVAKQGAKGAKKENCCRFGNCDPSGGAVCDPSSRGGAGPAPAVAALFSCVGGKLHLSHAWQRPCQCVIRHLLRLGGYGPAGGGRGLHSVGKRAGADGGKHRKHPSRL